MKRGGGQAIAAGRMPNDLESGVVQVLSFLFSYANVMPIPSPLGKAKEKAETTQLVLADAIPADENVLFPFLFVLFASSRLIELMS